MSHSRENSFPLVSNFVICNLEKIFVLQILLTVQN